MSEGRYSEPNGGASSRADGNDFDDGDPREGAEGAPSPPATASGVESDVVSARRRGLGRAGLLLSTLLVVAVGVLVHRFADALWGRSIDDVTLPSPRPVDRALAELVAIASDAPLVDGHEVEILGDDAVYGRLFDDIGKARESVTLFMYFCEPGAVADRFTAALTSAARRGVRVLFLGDDFGCGEYVAALRGPLGEAGGRAEALRPVRWYTVHRAQHRNHARSVVIDGRVGYTGGFGIADLWTGSDDGRMWREANVRFTGPMVSRLQSAFLASWTEATGTLLADPSLFGEASASVGSEGQGVAAGLLVSRPGLGPTPAQRYLTLTIAGATRTLYIANAYFVPSRSLRARLIAAAERGVDVRILIPGPRIDHETIRWAGQAHFDELLSGGVRLFEYEPAMMHAKTLVADGVWSTVGSLNFDQRSLRLNEEWTLLVHDPAFGGAMDSIFQADLERAREITLATHRARPFGERVRELLARLVAPLL